MQQADGYKYDVFVSYARKDCYDSSGQLIPSNSVSKILRLLEHNGISYWFDKKGICHGDRFTSVIVRSIRESRIFLFLSSYNSNSSDWTAREIRVADNLHKTIVPVRIDDAPFSDDIILQVASLDYVDFFANAEKAEVSLVDSLHGILARVAGETACNVQVTADRNGLLYMDGFSRGRLQRGKPAMMRLTAGYHDIIFKYHKGRHLFTYKDKVDLDKDTGSVAIKTGARRHVWIWGVVVAVLLAASVLTFLLTKHQPATVVTDTAPLEEVVDEVVNEDVVLVAQPEKEGQVVVDEESVKTLQEAPKAEHRDREKDVLMYDKLVSEVGSLIGGNPSSENLLRAVQKVETMQGIEKQYPDDVYFTRSVALQVKLNEELTRKSGQYVKSAYTMLKAHNDSGAVVAYYEAKRLMRTKEVDSLGKVLGVN